MRETYRKAIKRMAGWLFHPAPSFFDLCLAGFLALPFIKDGYRQQIFFIFYIIFLTCVSIGLKPERGYRSIPLMLLSLWAFCGVFIHSYVICEESITMKYLNMYLLSEGFIYILFGSLFILTVIKHSRNTRIFYLLIPIGLVPLVKQVIGTPNVTLVASIGISAIIYLILRQKWLYASILANSGLILAFFNWPLIQNKWPARPLVWKQLIKEISKHPWFGSGFYHGLEHPNNMIWVEQGGYGWLWRHNDWLSLGAFLGIFAIVFILWFYISSMKRIGIRLALIPLLAIGTMSFFQMNMFRVERAGLFLLIGALSIKRSYEKGGVK